MTRTENRTIRKINVTDVDAAKNEPQEETSTPLFLPSRTEQNSKLTWWVTYLRPSMPEHTAYPQIQMQ